MRRAASQWPALIVWAAATGAVITTCVAAGFAPFTTQTWRRSDSGAYLDIARDGYTHLFRCDPSLYPPHSWCGTAGWFPGYSWLVAVVHLTGLPSPVAAVALSWLFLFGTFVVLWAGFLARSSSVAAVGALVYAAFAPGQVYDYAVFPLSMLAFFTVAFLWLLHRDRPLAAGLAGAAAATAYPLGPWLAPVAALWLLSDRARPLRDRVRRTALAAGLTLAGVVAVFLTIWAQTGRWNAYFLVQAKYGHRLREPLAAVHDAEYTLVHGRLFTIDNAPATQTLFVAFVLACVLVEALLHRRGLQRLDVLLLLWAIVTWVVPHAEANLSLYRSQAALLPLALLLRRLPSGLVLVLATAAIAVSVPMEILFLRRHLW